MYLTFLDYKAWKAPQRRRMGMCADLQKALAVLTVLNDNYRSKKGDIHCSPRFIFDGRACTGDNIINQSKDIIYNTTNLRTSFKVIQNTSISLMNQNRWMMCTDYLTLMCRNDTTLLLREKLAACTGGLQHIHLDEHLLILSSAMVSYR